MPHASSIPAPESLATSAATHSSRTIPPGRCTFFQVHREGLSNTHSLNKFLPYLSGLTHEQQEELGKAEVLSLE